jgi:hypothetical protein
MRNNVADSISQPFVALLVAIVAAAGLLAVSMSHTARGHALAKQAQIEAPRVGPDATVSAGGTASVTAAAAGSYALVAQGTSASRVTVVRSSDGATVFTGSLGQLRHLNLGLLQAGETYSLKVQRGAPVHATLVAAV